MFDFLFASYLELVGVLVSCGVVVVLYLFYLQLKRHNELESLKRKKRIVDGFGTKN